MKFKPLLLALLVISPIASHAATDWTAKLQPMLSGCDYADVRYNLAPRYKSAIVKQTTKVDDKHNEESPTHTILLLRNSVAFGLPIERFKLDSADAAYTQTIYFKSGDFMKLRPLFKLPDVSGEDRKNLKNNHLGYSSLMRTLKFNAKEKSISCSGLAG